MTTYKQIVELFQNAASAHLAIQSFAEGTIDYLDASSQNIVYPYVFLRPLASPGLQGNIRSLTFELYSLDVPKLSTESPQLVMSNTELYLYDLISYMRLGPTNVYGLSCNLNSITPVNEAFNDRVYGWVGNISVTEDAVYNYCNFPDNP